MLKDIGDVGDLGQEKCSLGSRYNDGKLHWSLVDFGSFEGMVRVLEFGAKKYAAHNWKRGLKYTETIDSLLRHLFALLRGEDIDPESGLHHIGHIQCNSMFLGYMIKHRKDLDDRYNDPNYNKPKELQSNLPDWDIKFVDRISTGSPVNYRTTTTGDKVNENY